MISHRYLLCICKTWTFLPDAVSSSEYPASSDISSSTVDLPVLHQSNLPLDLRLRNRNRTLFNKGSIYPLVFPVFSVFLGARSGSLKAEKTLDWTGNWLTGFAGIPFTILLTLACLPRSSTSSSFTVVALGIPQNNLDSRSSLSLLISGHTCTELLIYP